MSSGGMGGGSTKTTQSTEPWKGVQPYLTQLFQRGAAQSNVPSTFYPGTTFAGEDPLTSEYYQALTNLARKGTPIMGEATDYTSDVLGGKYLGEQNPYLKAMLGNLTQEIGKNVGDQFSSSGGYMGSPGEQQTVAGEVSRAAMPYLFSTYGQERQAQGEASKNAILLDQIRKGDLSGLLQAGQAGTAEEQKAIDEARQRYEFGQQEPWQRLQMFGKLLEPGTNFSMTTGKQSGSGADTMGMVGGGISSLASLAMLAAFL